MRPLTDILLLVLLGATPILAQQLSYDKPPESYTNSLPTANDVYLGTESGVRLGEPVAQPGGELVVGGRLRANGPLLHPLGARNLWDFSKRLLDLVNPFTKASVPGMAERVERVDRVDPRAWSTIVGWSPGRSAFADDTHHEPQLRLLSLSANRR